MNATQDALYRVHQLQAERLGEAALPYEEFLSRVLHAYETDLTGLFAPPVGAKLKIQITVNTRFNLGQLCITQNVANTMPSDEILKALERHAAGDWGLVDQATWEQNDQAMRNGKRLSSVYQSSAGQRFWIITEANRSTTTVLLPEDD
jgi:hypothetical protein